MKKNIFLTGAPCSGKTTIVKKIIQKLPYPANGFYTQEDKENGKRVGFLMVSLEGKKGYLAHQDIESNFYIRRYGVSIENIESIAVPSIKPANKNIIILDEIGKMECFSEKFKKAVQQVLDSKNIVIGTIALGGDNFIFEVKGRPDMEIIKVEEDNRNFLPSLILEKISLIFA